MFVSLRESFPPGLDVTLIVCCLMRPSYKLLQGVTKRPFTVKNVVLYAVTSAKMVEEFYGLS